MTKRSLLHKAALIFLAGLLLLPAAALGKSKYVLDIQPLYQKDYTKTLLEYKGEERSVSSSGCGAVCASMTLGFLAPETEQTPETLFLWAYEKGYYEGHGLSINALTRMLEANGVEVELAGKAPKQIRMALKAGNPIIAYMGKGTFTSRGHYVLICGIDRKDRLMVIDPVSEVRSRWYPQEKIFNGLGTSAGLLICRLPQS